MTRLHSMNGSTNLLGGHNCVDQNPGYSVKNRLYHTGPSPDIDHHGGLCVAFYCNTDCLYRNVGNHLGCNCYLGVGYHFLKDKCKFIPEAMR